MPKFTLDIPITAPVPKEGLGAKSWRLLTHPITESLGLNPTLDKLADVKSSEVNDQGEQSWESALRNFGTGALEAVTPGHITAALTMTPELSAMASGGEGLTGASSILGLGGVPAVARTGLVASRPVQALAGLGNAAMVGESGMKAVKDSQDPTKSKTDVALDLLNAGIGAHGTFGAVRGFNRASSALKTVNRAETVLEPTSQAARTRQLDSNGNTINVEPAPTTPPRDKIAYTPDPTIPTPSGLKAEKLSDTAQLKAGEEEARGIEAAANRAEDERNAALIANRKAGTNPSEGPVKTSVKSGDEGFIITHEDPEIDESGSTSSSSNIGPTTSTAPHNISYPTKAKAVEAAQAANSAAVFSGKSAPYPNTHWDIDGNKMEGFRINPKAGTQPVVATPTQPPAVEATTSPATEPISQPVPEEPVAAPPVVEPNTDVPPPPSKAGTDNLFSAIKGAQEEGLPIPKDANRAVYMRLGKAKKLAAPPSEPLVEPDLPPVTQNPELPAQVQAVKEQLDDPNVDELTKTMLQRWLSDSGSGGSKGSINLPFLGRMTTGALGAGIGYQTDPLDNPTASTLAGGGLGFFAPDMAGLVEKGLISGGVKVSPTVDKLIDSGNRLHNTGLLSPFSVVKKGLGDAGGLGLAAIENPDRAGDMLRQVMSRSGRSGIANAFREGFTGPENEAATGLDNYIRNIKNPLSWSGKAMGGLTNATKHILSEANFSPKEQAYYTLTANPTTGAGKGLSALVNSSKLAKHVVPFSRIAINRLERAKEYSPFGLINKDLLSGDPELIKPIVRKAITGSVAAGSAYGLTPDNYVKEHPIAASMVAAAGGPLGIPILAGMAGKTVHKRNPDESFFNSAGDAMKAISQDIPGLRLIEDSTTDPKGLLRNYLSGYTNVTRPLALGLDKLNDVQTEPDVSSKDLSTTAKIVNRALSNIPGVRDSLPTKPEPSIFKRPKFTFEP